MEKTCSVSGKKFEVTDADLKIYEKLGLPAPTLCPDERNRRRMAWRNDRVFYRRKCDLTGKSIISIYPEKTPFPVYEHNAWWKDGWDPYEFGRDFDFSRNFFPQWQNLMNSIPRRSLDTVNCENSDFCNYCGDDKNCYLDIAGEANEDCYYNLFTKHSKNCADNTFVYRSELVYESISCSECFDCRWSMLLENCSACDFCFDCKGCTDCVFCWNLRRKKFCIFNEQLSKEEFEKRKSELRTDSHKHLEMYREKFAEMLRDSATHKNMQILKCENCDGNNIKNSKNTHFAFNVADCWDSSFLYDVLEATDCRDLNYSLYKPECSIEIISTLNLKFCFATMGTHFSNDLAYCDHCENSHDCFGCIGLNHGKYCIFNKKYSKEKYFELREKIISKMRETEEWGEFFPAEMSPHAYNETVAHEYFPLTKSEVESRGLRWKIPDAREFQKQKLHVPDLLADAEDSICDETFACEKTGKNFKIIPQELKFYRKMNVALPRICPDARHEARMKLRPPRELFERNCQNCGTKMQSPFSPERNEKVFCEKCFIETVN
ncbi:hypothetical protein HN954_03360 [bacterium]|jgi:CxxC-x17-CxxC domain-containing protein|nr:hypothetical protein [bacterium]MBT6832347.1 hypothetical protein [bacterium]MBT6996442.1 hypothetical protein [bacterium]MBT7772753.1 hypothetical protein [bacterium]